MATSLADVSFGERPQRQGRLGTVDNDWQSATIEEEKVEAWHLATFVYQLVLE